MGTSIVSPKSKTLVPDTTSADDDSIAAAQTPGGAGDLTLAGTASSFADAGVGLSVTVTGDGATDLRATNFTITGTNALGISASEVLAGPNGAATVTSTLKYNTVTQIAVSGGTTTAVRAGNAAGSGGSEQTIFAGRTRLRELFGDDLFIRTSKGMIPTPVANQIIKDVRSALSLIQNTISETEKFDPATAEMTFKISIGDSSEYRLLPLLVKELAEVAPKIKVETYLTPRKDAPRELSSGTIDFSIDPPVHSDPHLKHEKIYEEDYVMIVRKDHPILQKSEISLEDYLNLSHIHISNRKTGLGHVDMTLYRMGLSRDISLRAQHFLVAPYIVEQLSLIHI